MTNGSAAPSPLEIEWQFDAPDLDAVDRWLRAQPAHATLALEPAGDGVQSDTYYDSPDWRVFLAGYSFRTRERAVGAQATLKALGEAGAGPIARTEVTEPIPGNTPPDSDGPVGSRLRLILCGGELRPLFTVDTRRRTWNIRRDGHVLAEIAIDEAGVRANDVTTTLRRVEVEEVTAGGLGEADVLIEAMRAAANLTPVAGSKFAAGLAAAGLHPAGPDLGPDEITEDDTSTQRAFAVLRRQFGEVLAHEPGAALGEDPEELHAMRVATRRIRAALQLFETVLPPAVARARDDLRDIAAVLGSVRDLDVQIEHLEVLRDAASWDDANALAPLIEVLREQRIGTRSALIDMLMGDHYRRFVAGFRASLIEDGAPLAAVEDLREFAHPLIKRRMQRFERDARTLSPDAPHVQFHQLRIRGKRLRYSLEFFADIYGQPATVALRALRGVQDRLGDLQDLETTDTRLREVVRSHAAALPPETLVMLGRLLEQHRQRADSITAGSSDLLKPLLRSLDRLSKEMRERAKAAAEEAAEAEEAAGATPEPVEALDGSPSSTRAIIIAPPVRPPAAARPTDLRSVLTDIVRGALRRPRGN